MINKTKQAVRLFLFFAIFFINLTAYSAPRIPKEILANSLVYCTNVSNFSFDPQKSDVGTNMNVVTEQIYDKLIEFDSVTKKLKPALARSYRISDDGLEITFNLRKNVKFHSTKWFKPTRNFNAEDVIFSLNRVMGNVNNLPGFEELDKVRYSDKSYNNYIFQKQARRTHFPYFESINLKSKIVSITAPSKYVVKIKLADPDASLIAHLASQYAVILSQEYALQLSKQDNLAQLDQLPIGTGVYQLQNYVNNDYVRLKRNNDYWRKKANIENIIIDFSTNNIGKMAKFLNKECDITALPEPSQLSLLSRKHFVTEIGANLAFLAFNFQQPKMQDDELREDIIHAINRYRLSRQIFYGLAIVANNVLPSALVPDNELVDYQHELNFNQENKPKKQLKMWVIDEKRVYNYHPLKMADLIKFDLEKAGFDVKVKHVKRAFLVQKLESGKADYDLILTGWLANNYDPDNFLSAILSCHSQHSVTNLANWCNMEFEELLTQARISEDKMQRIKLYREIEKLLRKTSPILPLVNVNRLLVVSDRVKNVKIDPFGKVNLSRIKLGLN